MKYMPETLVSSTKASTPRPGICLETNEGVHHASDAYVKKLMISNLKDEARKGRRVFNQDFHIYGDAIGDAVMYDSTINAVIHCKH
jgi:hypothetical protein